MIDRLARRVVALNTGISRRRSQIVASQLVRRFVGGAAWSVGGSTVSSLLTLLSTMLVARILGKASFGQFVLLQGTLGMLGIFAGFGIGATATRYTAELKDSDPARLGRVLALTDCAVWGFGGLATVGLVLASSLLSTKILNAPTLQVPFVIAACGVFFNALDSYQKSVLIGFEAMRGYALGTIAGAFLGLPAMWVATSFYGLEGAAAGLVITPLVQGCISRLQMNKKLHEVGISRNKIRCAAEWRILRDFAVPSLVAGALVSPAHWYCQTLLANSSHGFAQVAELGVAMQWFNVIMFLPSVSGKVVLPILVEKNRIHGRADARKLLMLAVGANAIIAMPLALLAVIFSSTILRSYGTGFDGRSLGFSIAVCTAALVAIQIPVGNVIAAASRMWTGAMMNFCWAIVYVLTASLFVEHGATGVLAGMCIAYLFHSIWTFVFAYRYMNRGTA